MSPEENDLLTDVMGGSMGAMMRRYWLPALLSEEIPGPDSDPVQVRLLGEELVAFRDSEGRIGLIGEHCAHRGTSLVYGRNEQCGLRCIYHGWKYDVEGRIVDIPTGPSGMRERVRQVAYPCVERAGVIFAYLGPREEQPLFPHYTWAELPEDHTYVAKSLLECNYLQGLEGECDSVHLSFLHSRFTTGADEALYSPVLSRYETEETDFGVRLLAFRPAAEDRCYLRVSSFVMPSACWVPARGKEVHFYVPIDNTSTWRYDMGFRTDRPFEPGDNPGEERRRLIDANYVRVSGASNGYRQDRERQRKEDFTGIEGFLVEDAAATESMGPRFDRSREHLCPSDKAIIAVRRYLLRSVRGFLAGEPLPHLVRSEDENVFGHVDTLAQVIPAAGDWRRFFPHLTAGSGSGDGRAGAANLGARA